MESHVYMYILGVQALSYVSLCAWVKDQMPDYGFLVGFRNFGPVKTDWREIAGRYEHIDYY